MLSASVKNLDRVVKRSSGKEETAMGVNNQGIMHLARDAPGSGPVCKQCRAHISTTLDKFLTWDRRCKRCEVIAAKWQAKKDETERRNLEIFNSVHS